MHKFLFYIALILSLTACKTVKNSASKKSEHSAEYIKTFHEGIRLKLNNEIDASIANFQRCLVLDPKDDAVHFALSQLFLMKNDLSNASFHTKKAVEIDPENSHYQTELAFMYEELKQFEQAAILFDKMSKKQVQNIDLYLGSVENWARAGKTSKAIESLNVMEKFIGSSPEIAVQKFRLYSIAKDDKNALQSLLDAYKKYPNEPNIIANLVDYYMQRNKYMEGMKFLNELVAVDSNNGLALMMLGEMQMQIGEMDKGLANLKKSIKSDGPNLDQKMNVLISIQKNFPADQDLFSLVDYMTIKYPKNAKSHSIKGDYYFKKNEIPLAIESYKNAVKNDPNLYPIWNQVLLLEYQNQMWDSLAVDSEKCITLYPIQPLPYFTSGIALIQAKKYQDAETRLQEALDLITNDPTLEAEILGQLGEVNFSLNKIEKGKDFYQKAILKQPKSLFLKNNFAYRLLLQNIELELAEKLIGEVLKEKSNDARFINTNAYLLFRQGKFSQALKLNEEANISLPNDKIILDHIGDCYFQLGQKENAVIYWQKAKSAGSTNQVIDKKIQTKTYYDPIF